MTKDIHGHALSGANDAGAAAYEKAVRALNIYSGDPLAHVDAAIAEAPAFSMAHLFKGLVYATATEPEAAAGAIEIADHVRTLELNEREMSLLAALDQLNRGNLTRAALLLDQHSMVWPHDLVALQFGHLIDFLRGNARDLRDRIARALPRWSRDLPGHSSLLGFYAFGLEECGEYAKAEEMGLKAIDREPLDCWAHHAVAHVMEMQGRAAAGIKWMEDREPHWAGEDNFFQIHNWWHKAVFHLDLGETDEAIALYDGPIRAGKSGVAMDLVDASSLLWRLEMLGQPVTGRWAEVADAWDAHADGRLYPFNDWHGAMAYLGAGREAEVERILGTYRSDATADSEVTSWARTTGQDLIEGFRAFWHQDYTTAVEKLHGARYIANTFGGSHAQRDVIDWTLTEAAVRSGMTGVAEALANERLAHKPNSPVNHGFLKRLHGSAAAAQ